MSAPAAGATASRPVMNELQRRTLTMLLKSSVDELFGSCTLCRMCISRACCRVGQRGPGAVDEVLHANEGGPTRDFPHAVRQSAPVRLDRRPQTPHELYGAVHSITAAITRFMVASI